MQISVITTVLNEEGGVGRLLESLVTQTIQPDEIVVVDGGSTDNTLLIIGQYVEKYPYIRLLQKDGNISAGRNYAIENAKGEIIAQIDGGCVAESDWFEKITKPFSEDRMIQVVAGFYKMIGENPKQNSFAPYLGITKNKLSGSFLPSGRSIAFYKNVWQQAGGYDENLNTGEDTKFNYQLIKLGYKIQVEEEASVDWQLPCNYGEFFNKIKNYSKGDAKAHIIWHPAQRFSGHIFKILIVYARYTLLTLLLILGLRRGLFILIFVIFLTFYIFLAINKKRGAIEDGAAVVYLPLTQLISDFAVMLGFAQGVLGN